MTTFVSGELKQKQRRDENTMKERYSITCRSCIRYNSMIEITVDELWIVRYLQLFLQSKIVGMS